MRELIAKLPHGSMSASQGPEEQAMPVGNDAKSQVSW